MRFLHTADWHLGRIFHGLHLTNDQAHVLEQVVDLAKEARVEVVLISGDIYDRSVPPTEAVELLDYILSRLVLDLKLKVVLIAGNHDSPQRLGFASRLLGESGLTLSGLPSREVKPLILNDDHGPVAFCPVPYVEPAVARQVLENPDLNDHQAALGAMIERAREAIPAGARSVLLAHAFVQGGTASDSERPLSVGGAEQVPADILAGFDYLALGHLHRPQSVETKAIQYAGSILKYSFAEAGHDKSVTLVEMDAQGKCMVERVPLSPLHETRVVEGTLKGLLADLPRGVDPEDYLLVRLTDTGALFDPMGQLRQAYPNVLHLERTALRLAGAEGGEQLDYRKMSTAELFGAFFEHVEERSLTEKEQSTLTGVLGDLLVQDREASP